MVVVPRESLLKWRKNYGFYQRVSKIFSIVCLGNIRFGKLAIVDTYKYTLKKKKASSYKFIMWILYLDQTTPEPRHIRIAPFVEEYM